jgi:hypothetical protein
MFRAVFWVVLPCKMIVDRRFRGAYCLHHQGWIHSTGEPAFSLVEISSSHGGTTQKTALNIILAAVRTWNLTTKEKAGSRVETLYSNAFKQVFIFLYLYTNVRTRISPHKHLYRLLIAEHEKLSIKLTGVRQEVLREIWHTTYCLSNTKRNGAIG